MTTDEIIRMAFDLGTAVFESEEMSELQASQTKITQNKEAYGLIMEFQEAQGKIETGGPATPEQENQMKDLQQKLDDNGFVQELIKTQEKFDSLMQGIYFAMNQAISGSSGGCSEDGCSTCGGHCGA